MAPGRPRPAVIEELLEKGWSIDTRFQKNVTRDWYGLVAIAFIEKLKTTPRVATVFESKLLAEIAAREPAAAPIASFDGFSTEFERLSVPLQRIEDKLGIVSRDVGEIRQDVREIKESLGLIRKVPGWAWMVACLSLALAAAGSATQTGSRFLCRAPGVREMCRAPGIGGVPSPNEEAFWRSRPAGDCQALRAYLSTYPKGAYALEASHLVAGRREESAEYWVPEEKTHVFTLRTALEPAATAAAARAAALAQAATDIEDICASYSQGEYRLKSARAEAKQWRCSQREDGFHCGFDGLAICSTEARRVDIVERCR
ncbi:MAG: hypothetical protein KIT09_04590 [Bryobacteraceae bacterium]|nr:hypothetical protein [Bryobacteraceae bacterium]